MLSVKTVGAYEVETFDSPIPVPGEGEVAVRMLAVGICASDIQIYHGKHKYVKFPIVQGHEGVGIVHAAGPGTDFRPGDRVNIQQQLACGVCYACKKGRHNVCINMLGLIGIHVGGLFTEYFRCPAWNAIKVHPDFTTDKAMLVEPASVGVNSARVAGVRQGDRAVVIGAGIIGNFTAQACRALGAADVLVTDIADAKLEVARRNGIGHCVNTADTDLAAAVADAFGGEPADVVFDCAGSEATLKQAIAVAANAGRVVIVANFKQPVTLEIPTFQRREIAVLSVMGTVKESSIEAIDLLHRGKIGIDGIISARFPLDRMKDAYQYIDDNPATVMKVAVEIGR